MTGMTGKEACKRQILGLLARWLGPEDEGIVQHDDYCEVRNPQKGVEHCDVRIDYTPEGLAMLEQAIEDVQMGSSVRRVALAMVANGMVSN